MTATLFRPHAALARHVDFYGYWDRRTAGTHRSRALPRGAFTVVIDVSGRDGIDLFAADGATRVTAAPAVALGAGTQSYVTCTSPRQTVLTVHFKPAGARAFIDVPAEELCDRCVGLGDLWGDDALLLQERLIAETVAARRIALVERFLLSRAGTGMARLPADVSSALGAIDRDPSMRVRDVRAVAGLSEKALGAAFRAHVGLTPKAYLRVRRLQGALRRLDQHGVLGAHIAAELGYFDQPHFVREFRLLTQTTPTGYRHSGSLMPGHIDLSG